ncbi:MULTISPECIES: TetR/AcrR family transcriptional regulator [unclassified Streptomyces]|uniref:TetR/AcrR family transcriptional regulator n=1 Tax=unclassified Streptomyces TaxID=2593676 RepID=UPI0033BC4FC4
MRKDQRENNTKLIQAAAELFERCRQPISLADIARQANVSVATAYRHFESADDALSAYRRGIGGKFRDYSLEQPGNGLLLLERVCGYWVELILAEGAALVHRRSSEGFLARHKADEPYLKGQAEALARPIRELVAILGVSELAGVEEEAAFLWNVLFDPREIFDLRETLALSPAQITHRLVSAFRGALLGWATARLTEPG